MAYSTPITAVLNTALTSPQWNASVRDNFLASPIALASQSGSIFAGTGVNGIAERVPTSSFVTALETTTLTAYAALPAGTTGPAVNVTSGTKVLIMHGGYLFNSTVNQNSYISVDITGAHTLAASDTHAVAHTSSTANAQVACSTAIMHNVTAGLSNYNLLYRVGANTGTFANRRISVIPF